ncbi:hypothetical protein RZO55_22175 [Clostridium boliviensis]|uniref:FCD domain-containing protein n=1 Tax=Clostridium boliviensis TaxID=318465 RepID=A0ABU4GRL9_9CLOT|nr:hypothetical protein [Clostridium boliviensis]MDW2800282.1 hypothetical protein [Clostridium boliviensis]
MIHLTTANALTVTGRTQATLEEHENFYHQLKSGNTDQAYQILIAHLMMPLSMNLI